MFGNLGGYISPLQGKLTGTSLEQHQHPSSFHFLAEDFPTLGWRARLCWQIRGFYVRTLVPYLHFGPTRANSWNPFDIGFGMALKFWSIPRCQTVSNSWPFGTQFCYFPCFVVHQIGPNDQKRTKTVWMAWDRKPGRRCTCKPNQIYIHIVLRYLTVKSTNCYIKIHGPIPTLYFYQSRVVLFPKPTNSQ